MRIGSHDIGIVSWSLPGVDLPDVPARVRELGLAHVQVALVPLLFGDDTRREQVISRLLESDVTLLSGMIAFPNENYASIAMIRESGGFVPDAEWPVRQELATRAAELANRLSLPAVSVHAGFLSRPGSPEYDKLVERIRSVAEHFAGHNVDLLLETGQETASELLQLLNDLGSRNVAVNFDPANMILYGAGDPIEAITTLGRHIRQVHVKDATLSDSPGLRWGTEVPFGHGDVKPTAFLRALHDAGYQGPLVIEAEAGNPDEAIRGAVEALEQANA